MKALINRINRRLANRASIWLLFLTCVFAVGVNAEPKIVGETVIKGFSARMSTDEFIRVSQSYNPRGNPKPNVFVFVDCYKTWAQWNIELHTDLGLEPTDEDLAKWREEGCYELADGAHHWDRARRSQLIRLHSLSVKYKDCLGFSKTLASMGSKKDSG